MQTEVISAFSELSAVVVKVDKDIVGRRVSWSYQPVLVTQEGKEYKIIDASPVWEKSLDDFAYKLGELLDIPAFPSRQQECTHIIFDPYEKRITIEYHPDPPSRASTNIKILIHVTIMSLVLFGLFFGWLGRC